MVIEQENHEALTAMRKPESNQKLCFALILLLANRFQSKLDSYTGEITLKQWLLICMLANMKTDPASVNDLAEVVGCSRQNVKKMVAILVKKGYMELNPSRLDKRAYEVKLTERAKAFFVDFEATGDGIIDQLFKGITPADLAITANTMATTLNNMETM